MKIKLSLGLTLILPIFISICAYAQVRDVLPTDDDIEDEETISSDLAEKNLDQVPTDSNQAQGDVEPTEQESTLNELNNDNKVSDKPSREEKDKEIKPLPPEKNSISR